MDVHETLEVCTDAAGQLCASLLAKIHEQIEGTEHLIGLLPADRLDWVPAIPGIWPTGVAGPSARLPGWVLRRSDRL